MSLDENLYQYLKLNGKQDRMTICQQLGKARTTVLDSLVRLEIQGLVKRETYRNPVPAPGRPRVFFGVIN